MYWILANFPPSTEWELWIPIQFNDRDDAIRFVESQQRFYKGEVNLRLVQEVSIDLKVPSMPNSNYHE